jgi:glycosyltransferase involved in cell wall biosynthesis
LNQKLIAIDACCLGRQKTGNETYVRGLLTGLSQIQPAQYKFCVITTSSHKGERNPYFQWLEIPLGNFITRNFRVLPETLASLKADLFHASYWTRFWAQPCPSLLMVHDLSFVSFPKGFHKHEQFVYSRLVRKCAENARHLVTVSEFSKQELMVHWKIPPEKITVTYDGIDAHFQPGPSTQEKDAKPYILYVGNLHPRKNLVRLIEAFVLLKSKKHIPHSLKIVGQAAWLANDVFKTVRNRNLENAVEFTGYVEQNRLVSLYQQASLTVYPSLYEGFGLPPMEAMACGCPVVTSNRTALPEVTGGKAVLVNPDSASDIARGISSVLDDRGLREQLIRTGPTQAVKFNWQHCAEQSVAAYNQALGLGQ